MLQHVRRLVPWWCASVPLVLGFDQLLPTAATLPAPWVVGALLVLALTCCLVVVGGLGVVCDLGYREVSDWEAARRPGGPLAGVEHLVHISSAPTDGLLDEGGLAWLDPARCRLGSLLWDARRPWRRPRRAVYLHAAAPSSSVVGAHLGKPAIAIALWRVSAPPPARLVIAAEQLRESRVYTRWDGCVALPDGYRGPAAVVLEGRAPSS